MKALLTALFGTLFLNSLALAANPEAVYLSLTKKDGTKILGEFIERYEDRWFYQESTKESVKYLLLFKVDKGEAKFNLINVKDIKRVRLLKVGSSSYRNFLRMKNIELETEIVKGMHILTGNEGHHKFERMFGNFAWDLGILDESGRQFDGSGEELSDFYIFNKSVYSPIEGVVVGKVSDQPDNPPSLNLEGDLSKKINNYLTLKIQYPFYLSIVHFKKDSIKVNLGDRVTAGQELGLVGNSGVSYLPHLHYTLYIFEEDLQRFISVPAVFKYK